MLYVLRPKEKSRTRLPIHSMQPRERVTFCELISNLALVSSLPHLSPVPCGPCGSTVSPWVRGLCGAPDAPHIANVSPASAEEVGSGVVGKPKLPSSLSDLTKQSHHEPVRISFHFNFDSTEHQDVNWDAILWRKNLYLQIPNGILVERSKEAFIELLEFAEEELLSNNIVVCFNKTRAERNTLMRMFMFLGFMTLPPNHPMAPMDASDDILYMAYNVG